MNTLDIVIIAAIGGWTAALLVWGIVRLAKKKSIGCISCKNCENCENCGKCGRENRKKDGIDKKNDK